MTEERPSDVLGALPRTRPHRRSNKRAKPASAGRAGTPAPKTGASAAASTPPKAAAGARTPRAVAPTRLAAPKAPKEAPPTPIRAAGPRRRRRDETLRQPAQPPGTPAHTRTRRPPPPSGAQILGTAVQAVAELTEIGLMASARALRNAVARLPRP
jgi:hypothetical protein